jgi:hypothetical protein
MMQSIGALALSYNPTAADVAAINAMFEKVKIVAENRQRLETLGRRTQELQTTIPDENIQMQYMLYITDLMVEYFRLFEPSNCGCGANQQ